MHIYEVKIKFQQNFRKWFNDHSCTVATTVVMATHGLHWKWQSLTPCQRHPSEPIEKIFGEIDYVIDLNNLAKFGFGKIFGDGGTYAQHIRQVCAFFSFFFLFFKLFTLFDEGAAKNGWTDFDVRYVYRRRLASQTLSRNKKDRSMILTLKRFNSDILFDLQNFDPHFLGNGMR